MEKITDKNLNVRQTDELIDDMLNKQKSLKNSSFIIPNFSSSSPKDMRLFSNTLRHAIDLIRRQGIDATSVETEYDDYIEYIITVSKEVDECKILKNNA